MIVWQVGQRLSHGPTVLRAFLSSISILQLDTGSILHPACYASSPFQFQLSQFVSSLAVCGVTVLLFAVSRSPIGLRPGPRKRLATAKRLAMSTLVLLYPLVTNAALRMVNCTRDGGTGAPLLLRTDPLVTCYVGDHFLVGVLAWLVLACHVVGFPLVGLACMKNFV